MGMHRSSLLLAALALACGLARPSAVDACARPQVSEELVTPDGASLTSDGGVITETRFDQDRFSPDEDDKDRIRGFEARAPNGAVLATTGEYIAPMLSVLHVTSPGSRFDVVRGKTRIRSFTVAKHPELSAPRLASASSTLSASASMAVTKAKMGGPSGEVSYTLAGEAPTDAYALVLLQITPTGSLGVAYAHPGPKLKTFSYPFGGKRCRGGFTGLRQGERVAAAWLDVHGRLSKPSTTIVVGAPPRPAKP